MDNHKDIQTFKLTQKTFQRCFNVVCLYKRCNVWQCQINVETTLCSSTLEFTKSNNVESTLCISTLIWTSKCLNIVVMAISKQNKKNHFKLYTRNSKFQLLFQNLLHFTPHVKRNTYVDVYLKGIIYKLDPDPDPDPQKTGP